MITDKGKCVNAGPVIAAMLISPDATPPDELYLFVAQGLLFEVSILVGKRFEHN
jgi:Sec-independent protein secretion pathway component TatC